MKNFVLFLLFVIPAMSKAQSGQDDLLLVKTTVENYFYGYVDRNIVQLNAAFDTTNGTMKIPYQSEEGKEGFKNGSFSEIVKKWGSRKPLSAEDRKACTLEIQDIDVVDGKLATARLKMKVVDKVYLDILSLQKMNGQWKITNKMYITLH